MRSTLESVRRGKRLSVQDVLKAAAGTLREGIIWCTAVDVLQIIEVKNPRLQIAAKESAMDAALQKRKERGEVGALSHEALEHLLANQDLDEQSPDAPIVDLLGSRAIVRSILGNDEAWRAVEIHEEEATDDKKRKKKRWKIKGDNEGKVEPLTLENMDDEVAPGAVRGWGREQCDLLLREWKVCHDLRRDAVFTVLQNNVVSPFYDKGVLDSLKGRCHMFSATGPHNNVWHDPSDLYFMKDVSSVITEIIDELRTKDNGGKLAEEKRLNALKQKKRLEAESLQRESMLRRGSLFGVKKSVSKKIGGGTFANLVGGCISAAVGSFKGSKAEKNKLLNDGKRDGGKVEGGSEEANIEDMKKVEVVDREVGEEGAKKDETMQENEEKEEGDEEEDKVKDEKYEGEEGDGGGERRRRTSRRLFHQAGQNSRTRTKKTKMALTRTTRYQGHLRSQAGGLARKNLEIGRQSWERRSR